MSRNDRFSTPVEIKRELVKLSDKHGGGPVLWVDPETHEVYVLNSESNLIFLGVSGAGKTRRGIVNMVLACIQAKESYVLEDPKGDLLNITSSLAKKAGYRIVFLNFRDIINSQSVNLLEDLYILYKSGDVNKIQAAEDGIQDMSHCIFKHSKHADPFWIDCARSLCEACVKILFERGKPEEINILSVIKMISAGVERFGAKKVFDIICDDTPDDVATWLLQTVRRAPNDTLGSILSSTFEPLNIYIKSPELAKMLSTNEFSIDSLDVDQPTAVYIVTPDENSNYASITGILISQIMNHYIRLAHEKYSGRLKRRVNLCIEELGNLGENAIPNLAHLMSAGRSRNIRTSIVLQSFSQLDDMYGKSTAETIVSNADTIIAYRTNCWDTLEELSRKFGERQIKYSGHIVNERLITASQIGAMETGRVLVSIRGRIKFSTVLPDYTEIFPMDEWEPPMKHKRVSRDIKTYDLAAEAKRLVEEKAKANGDLMGLSPSNPFAAPNPFAFPNPFVPVKSATIVEDPEEPKKSSTPPSESSVPPIPSDIDIDDMIRNIDEKLLEIQEEEDFLKKKKLKEGEKYYEAIISKEDFNGSDELRTIINNLRENKLKGERSEDVSLYFVDIHDAIDFANQALNHHCSVNLNVMAFTGCIQ